MIKILNIFFMPINWKTVGLILVLASTFFVYPILSADIYYEDDYMRKNTGQYVWQSSGRPLTEILMHGITLQEGRMSDAGQFPQVLSIGALALAAYALAKKYIHRPNLSKLLLPSLVIFNPYLLTNLSYRYDSLGMILGYLAAILAFTLFAAKRKNVLYSVILLTASALFYQPMMNVFLALIVIDILWSVYKKLSPRIIAHLLLLRLGVYVLAIGLYTLITKFIFISTTDRGTFIPISLDGAKIASTNLLSVVKYVSVFFTAELTLLLAPFVIAAVVGLLYLAIQYYKSYIQKSFYFWIVLIIFLSSPALLLFSLHGPLILLDTDIILHQRTFPTFFAIFLFVLLLSYITLQKLDKRLTVILILPFIYFSSYAYIYGSLARNQREYDYFVIDKITTYLVLNEAGDKPVTVTGWIGRSTSTNLAFNNIPSLQQTNLSGLSATWVKFILFNYGLDGTDRQWTRLYPAEQKAICSSNISPIYSSEHFDVYKNPTNNGYAIWLGSRSTDNYCAYKGGA